MSKFSSTKKTTSASVKKARTKGRPMSSPRPGKLERHVFRFEAGAAADYRAAVLLEDARSRSTASSTLEKMRPCDAPRTMSRLATLRKVKAGDNSQSQRIQPEKRPPLVTAGRVAIKLALAKAIDLLGYDAASEKLPNVILVDIPDAEMLKHATRYWRDVLCPESRVLSGLSIELGDEGSGYDAIEFIVEDPPKPREVAQNDSCALQAIQFGIPIIALSPATSYLPFCLLNSKHTLLTLPTLDKSTIMRVIEVVTGNHPDLPIDSDLVRSVRFSDIIIAIRYDNSADECVEELHRLARERVSKRKSRDLTLAELHGLDDAVDWAKSTIKDVEAWRRGDIVWDQVDGGVVLNGPSGTGKTTFAKVLADELNAPIIVGSLAKWQGHGHLGDLLKAMRSDFAAAAALASSHGLAVFYIDELDSFQTRANVKHDRRDYVIEVINGFLELLDGIQVSREGIIFVSSCNNVSTVDPAIVRPGRLNRIIEVRLPKATALEAMFRVRLREDLSKQPLDEIALLALGSTGADVERMVKDARRAARLAGRPLNLVDLQLAVSGKDDRTPHRRMRAAVHEAGHIIIDVEENGPSGVFANISVSSDRGGTMTRTSSQNFEGTYADYRSLLRVMLGGRTAEIIVHSAPSHGASADLQQATRVAASMVGSLGLAGPSPLLHVAGFDETETILRFPDLRRAINEELTSASDWCRSYLTRHRDALNAVADVLMKNRRIDGHEVARILARSASREPVIDEPLPLHSSTIH
jgi:cell division protease FtsH